MNKSQLSPQLDLAPLEVETCVYLHQEQRNVSCKAAYV